MPSQTATDLSTTFIVVRHGQTVWNAEGRWQGWLDSNLTELGRDQAERAAHDLQYHHIDAAYSSDSGRAIKTARIIADRHALEPLPVEGLRERFYGDFEGLSTEEIEARYPGARYQEGRDLRATWRPPGGESLDEVRERVAATLRILAEKHLGETVLLVTHSGVVRVLDSLATGESLEDIWDRGPTNACIFVLEAGTTGHIRVVTHFCKA